MDSMTFVLFGGTGDLAKRKIYPALYNLFLEGKLPKPFSAIGLGRREISNSEFRNTIKQSLASFSRRKLSDVSKTEAFLNGFYYCSVDATKKEDYQKLLKLVKQREQELSIPENRMFYLSVAPELFDVIALNIKESGLGLAAGWKRLIIEKPFGHDLESARELNAKLSKAFDENEIYRIDHYLGKPMVQNLEILGAANPIVQALWNNHYIANVQITASETVGVEKRAGYYDHAGAIRDMVQNHMMQMLMMTALKLSKKMTPDEIRQEKKKIMESLRPLKKEDVMKNLIRGQYAAGSMNGTQVLSYTDEPGVAADSQTDTFIAARLWIDSLDWNGVPFYIRTGKRMKEKSTRIVVEFKNPESESKTAYSNLLVVEINPNEGVSLLLNRKNPVIGGKLEPIKVDYLANRKDIPEAYETLIYDALCGDATFFAHWDEVELSWKWVQPVLDAFTENIVPLCPYPAGSNGPVEAQQLLKADGFKWWLDKETEKVETNRS